MSNKCKGALNLKKLVFLILFFALPTLAFQQSASFDQAVRRYIATYHQIAVEEMNLFRIPASITLAQGIFESNAGMSNLAVIANNHFGIKCHKEWTGEKYIQDDETRNECFRKYDKPEESFRDHSLFLTMRDRYEALFLLDISDYQGWAKGLKEAGYATNPRYAEMLIRNIETYQLYRFDRPGYLYVSADSLLIVKDSIAKKPEEKKLPELVGDGPGKHKIYKVNGVKLTVGLKGDTWSSMSKLFKVAERKLLKFNDLEKKRAITPSQFIFLEKKGKKGPIAKYQVKPGETMYMISQTHGIQLKALYKMNKMKPGQKITPGQTLLFR